MSSHHQQFATEVLAAFVEAGRVTDQEVWDAGGPSDTTLGEWRKIADGKAEFPKMRAPTYAKIDEAADWEPGTARKRWAELERGGAGPRRLAEVAEPTMEGRVSDLERRLLDVERSLSEVSGMFNDLAASVDKNMGDRDREPEEPDDA